MLKLNILSSCQSFLNFNFDFNFEQFDIRVYIADVSSKLYKLI